MLKLGEAGTQTCPRLSDLMGRTGWHPNSTLHWWGSLPGHSEGQRGVENGPGDSAGEEDVQRRVSMGPL